MSSYDDVMESPTQLQIRFNLKAEPNISNSINTFIEQGIIVVSCILKEVSNTTRRFTSRTIVITQYHVDHVII